MISSMGSVLGLCLAGLSGVIQDGSGDLKKHSHPMIEAAPGPVTKSEAIATFNRLENVLKSELHIQVSGTRPITGSKGLISKSEVIKEFVWLVKICEPAFSVTPKAVPVEAARLVVQDATLKPKLTKLITGGFVGNYGALATGSASTLNVRGFGDSVGFFLARIGECTHIPSSKWTPYLHGD